jgi:hypothetical protein
MEVVAALPAVLCPPLHDDADLDVLMLLLWLLLPLHDDSDLDLSMLLL